MVPWHARFRVPLYLRIWLAVVLAVAVLTVAFGWLWRLNAEQAPQREVIVRNEDGDVLGQVMTRPIREPGQPTEFRVPMNDGSSLILQFPRRERRRRRRPARAALVGSRARRACCGSWASWPWPWPSAATPSSGG